MRIEKKELKKLIASGWTLKDLLSIIKIDDKIKKLIKLTKKGFNPEACVYILDELKKVKEQIK